MTSSSYLPALQRTFISCLFPPGRLVFVCVRDRVRCYGRDLPEVLLNYLLHCSPCLRSGFVFLFFPLFSPWRTHGSACVFGHSSQGCEDVICNTLLEQLPHWERKRNCYRCEGKNEWETPDFTYFHFFVSEGIKETFYFRSISWNKYSNSGQLVRQSSVHFHPPLFLCTWRFEFHPRFLYS